jgi:phospholipase/lecithinase/hemolysin
MSFREHLSRVATRAAAGLLAAVALASCGGGTYQVNSFAPERILSFGDEGSVLVPPQGLKYSINGVSPTTDLVDCSLLPLWNQVLATSFGMTYEECNPEAVASPTAFNFSAPNATIDDVTTQVNAFLSGDSFSGKDLVTIWVGLHDILEIYAEGGTGGDNSQLILQARARGEQLAGLVNTIVGLGAKVLVLTIPDMGQSPFAYNEQNAHGDFNRVQLLSDMSNNFNRAMRSTVINDGSKVGLVLPDDYVNSATRSPGSFGYASDAAITAGCLDTAPLPTCNENTLVVDPVTNTSTTTLFLWADPTHLGPTAHNSIGQQANSRAHSNPF